MEKSFQLVDQTLEDLVIKNFLEKKIIKIDHIGILFLTKRNAKSGRNPQTGVSIFIPHKILPVFLAFQYSADHGKPLTEDVFDVCVQEEKFDVFDYHNEDIINTFKSLMPNKDSERGVGSKLYIRDKNDKLILFLSTRYLMGITEKTEMGTLVFPETVFVHGSFSKELRTSTEDFKPYVHVDTRVNESYRYHDDGDSRVPRVVDFVGLTKIVE